MECTQRGRMTGMVAGYHQETESKGGYFEECPFFDCLYCSYTLQTIV